MQVHLLNCATMKAQAMVAACLLIETELGVILVDTALGQWCHDHPEKAYGKPFVKITRPILDPKEYAINQLAELGYQASDVKHIVMTHLDVDHTGGLADFPKARVHVHAKEFHASQTRLNWMSKMRYKPEHWQHNPEWILHQMNGGDKWFGFDASTILANMSDLLLIRLKGHSEGHIGVAVKLNDGPTPKWLFHTGDAFMSPLELDPQKPRPPFIMRISPAHGWGLYEGFHETQARIRDIHNNHSDKVIVINSHSSALFNQAQKRLHHLHEELSIT